MNDFSNAAPIQYVNGRLVYDWRTRDVPDQQVETAFFEGKEYKIGYQDGSVYINGVLVANFSSGLDGSSPSERAAQAVSAICAALTSGQISSAFLYQVRDDSGNGGFWSISYDADRPLDKPLFIVCPADAEAAGCPFAQKLAGDFLVNILRVLGLEEAAVKIEEKMASQPELAGQALLASAPFDFFNPYGFHSTEIAWSYIPAAEKLPEEKIAQLKPTIEYGLSLMGVPQPLYRFYNNYLWQDEYEQERILDNLTPADFNDQEIEAIILDLPERLLPAASKKAGWQQARNDLVTNLYGYGMITKEQWQKWGNWAEDSNVEKMPAGLKAIILKQYSLVIPQREQDFFSRLHRQTINTDAQDNKGQRWGASNSLSDFVTNAYGYGLISREQWHDLSTQPGYTLPVRLALLNERSYNLIVRDWTQGKLFLDLTGFHCTSGYQDKRLLDSDYPLDLDSAEKLAEELKKTLLELVFTDALSAEKIKNKLLIDQGLSLNNSQVADLLRCGQQLKAVVDALVPPESRAILRDFITKKALLEVKIEKINGQDVATASIYLKDPNGKFRLGDDTYSPLPKEDLPAYRPVILLFNKIFYAQGKIDTWPGDSFDRQSVNASRTLVGQDEVTDGAVSCNIPSELLSTFFLSALRQKGPDSLLWLDWQKRVIDSQGKVDLPQTPALSPEALAFPKNITAREGILTADNALWPAQAKKLILNLLVQRMSQKSWPADTIWKAMGRVYQNDYAIIIGKNDKGYVLYEQGPGTLNEIKENCPLLAIIQTLLIESGSIDKQKADKITLGKMDDITFEALKNIFSYRGAAATNLDRIALTKLLDAFASSLQPRSIGQVVLNLGETNQEMTQREQSLTGIQKEISEIDKQINDAREEKTSSNNTATNHAFTNEYFIQPSDDRAVLLGQKQKLTKEKEAIENILIKQKKEKKNCQDFIVRYYNSLALSGVKKAETYEDINFDRLMPYLANQGLLGQMGDSSLDVGFGKTPNRVLKLMAEDKDIGFDYKPPQDLPPGAPIRSEDFELRADETSKKRLLEACENDPAKMEQQISQAREVLFTLSSSTSLFNQFSLRTNSADIVKNHPLIAVKIYTASQVNKETAGSSAFNPLDYRLEEGFLQAFLVGNIANLSDPERTAFEEAIQLVRQDLVINSLDVTLSPQDDWDGLAMIMGQRQVLETNSNDPINIVKKTLRRFATVIFAKTFPDYRNDYELAYAHLLINNWENLNPQISQSAIFANRGNITEAPLLAFRSDEQQKLGNEYFRLAGSAPGGLIVDFDKDLAEKTNRDFQIFITDIKNNADPPKALANYLQANFTYAPDPKNITPSPVELFYQAEKKVQGTKIGGDCDHFARFANSVLQAAGYQTRVVFIDSGPGNLNHTICLFRKTGNDNWSYFDNLNYCESEKSEIKSPYESDVINGIAVRRGLAWQKYYIADIKETGQGPSCAGVVAQSRSLDFLSWIKALQQAASTANQAIQQNNFQDQASYQIYCQQTASELRDALQSAYYMAIKSGYTTLFPSYLQQVKARLLELETIIASGQMDSLPTIIARLSRNIEEFTSDKMNQLYLTESKTGNSQDFYVDPQAFLQTSGWLDNQSQGWSLLNLVDYLIPRLRQKSEKLKRPATLADIAIPAYLQPGVDRLTEEMNLCRINRFSYTDVKFLGNQIKQASADPDRSKRIMIYLSNCSWWSNPTYKKQGNMILKILKDNETVTNSENNQAIMEEILPLVPEEYRANFTEQWRPDYLATSTVFYQGQEINLRTFYGRYLLDHPGFHWDSLQLDYKDDEATILMKRVVNRLISFGFFNPFGIKDPGRKMLKNEIDKQEAYRDQFSAIGFPIDPLSPEVSYNIRMNILGHPVPIVDETKNPSANLWQACYQTIETTSINYALKDMANLTLRTTPYAQLKKLGVLISSYSLTWQGDNISVGPDPTIMGNLDKENTPAWKDWFVGQYREKYRKISADEKLYQELTKVLCLEKPEKYSQAAFKDGDKFKNFTALPFNTQKELVRLGWEYDQQREAAYLRPNDLWYLQYSVCDESIDQKKGYQLTFINASPEGKGDDNARIKEMNEGWLKKTWHRAGQAIKSGWDWAGDTAEYSFYWWGIFEVDNPAAVLDGTSTPTPIKPAEEPDRITLRPDPKWLENIEGGNLPTTQRVLANCYLGEKAGFSVRLPESPISGIGEVNISLYYDAGYSDPIAMKNRLATGAKGDDEHFLNKNFFTAFLKGDRSDRSAPPVTEDGKPQASCQQLKTVNALRFEEGLGTAFFNLDNNPFNNGQNKDIAQARSGLANSLFAEPGLKTLAELNAQEFRSLGIMGMEYFLYWGGGGMIGQIVTLPLIMPELWELNKTIDHAYDQHNLIYPWQSTTEKFADGRKKDISGQTLWDNLLALPKVADLMYQNGYTGTAGQVYFELGSLGGYVLMMTGRGMVNVTGRSFINNAQTIMYQPFLLP